MSTRVLGVDPGPRVSAWALVEVNHQDLRYRNRAAAISYLAHGEIEGDTDTQCAALRLLLADHLDIFSTEQGLCLVAVEAVAGFAFQATSNRGGGQAIVAALMATSRVVGELVRTSKDAGRPTIAVTAGRARKIVLNRASATDATVKAGVLRYVRGWPTRSNVHARDAALLSLATAWSLRNQTVEQVALAGAI